MSRRPPNADNFTQMLLMQNMIRQQQLAIEQAGYLSRLQQQRFQAQATVDEQQKALDAGIRRATAKPVKLGTLLTGPTGLFGNPLLSSSKLSG
jgi:hypothetical protein